MSDEPLSSLIPCVHSQVHLAVLGKCNHVIMSVGTFGFWAGYLSGGDVIYYTPPYKKGSPLDIQFSGDDFFLPKWIGIGD